MKVSEGMDFVAAERRRMLAEYRRREETIRPERYSPWEPSEMFMRVGRRRLAAALLNEAGVCPGPGDPCLEVGFGSLGWLGDLLCWGVREMDLHGIELDAVRAERAKEILPRADLRVGDATELPWDSNTFRLVNRFHFDPGSKRPTPRRRGDHASVES